MGRDFHNVRLSARPAVFIGVLMLLSVILIYVHSWRPLPFDAAQWRAARARCEYKVCYRMSESLVDEMRKSRPSMAEATSLFGLPDYQKTRVLFNYRLGMLYFFPMHYWLSVAYDGKGEFTRASITAD